MRLIFAPIISQPNAVSLSPKRGGGCSAKRMDEQQAEIQKLAARVKGEVQIQQVPLRISRKPVPLRIPRLIVPLRIPRLLALLCIPRPPYSRAPAAQRAALLRARGVSARNSTQCPAAAPQLPPAARTDTTPPLRFPPRGNNRRPASNTGQALNEFEAWKNKCEFVLKEDTPEGGVTVVRPLFIPNPTP